MMTAKKHTLLIEHADLYLPDGVLPQEAVAAHDRRRGIDANQLR